MTGKRNSQGNGPGNRTSFHTSVEMNTFLGASLEHNRSSDVLTTSATNPHPQPVVFQDRLQRLDPFLRLGFRIMQWVSNRKIRVLRLSESVVGKQVDLLYAGKAAGELAVLRRLSSLSLYSGISGMRMTIAFPESARLERLSRMSRLQTPVNW